MISRIYKLLQVSSNKQRIAKNVYWALIGKIVNVLSSLLVGIFVARYLGPAQYGLMNYVISYVSIFSVLANFGMDNIEVRELAKNEYSRETLLGTAFRLKILFATLTMAIIAATVSCFNADTYTRAMIIVYSFSMIFNSFNVIRNYFTSIVLNEYVVKSEILRYLVGASIKIVLLLVHASLTWFIISNVVDVMLVASGYLYSYKHKAGSFSTWNFNKKVAIYLMKQSFPLLLSGTAIIIYQRIDQVMISKMIDNASVGYFSTAGKFVELIVFLPVVIAQTISPILIQTKQQSIEEYQKKSQIFINVTVWTSILLSVAVSLCSYFLIRYSFGLEYIAAVPVLQIMAFKAVAMGLSSTGGQLIIIEGIQKFVFVRNIIGCIVCFCLNLILIPKYGIIGSAYVTIITVFTSGFLSNLLIPSYRHIFTMQIKAIVFGWKDILNIKSLLKR